MKICFIGCVKFSADALRVLFELERNSVCSVVGVITKSSSRFNADFVDLSEVVADSGRPDSLVHYYESQKAAERFIAGSGADVVYCFGWSSLLGPGLLASAPKGVIGFHPAHLPENRGRHPIIWALTLGLGQTASTFFRMDAGADSGPILSQEPIRIDSADNARSLYGKITETALGQIEVFTRSLSEGRGEFREQDESKATYWRKRSAADGLIDWRMPASDIHNLVRALYHPYPGAEFKWQAQTIKLWETRLADEGASLNAEPGKVLQCKDESLLVKCGGNTAIWLVDFRPGVEISVGTYL